MRLKILLLFFFFYANSVIAQVYPVQGTAALIPPYALRLSDYQTSVNEKFVLNAFLADVTKPELHVRLRIRIEGQNVKLETKPEYIGSMITMTGGVPLRLSNIELAEYFDPNHLNFSGISKNDFLKTGFLPEGFYQFCFEVLEYNRGVKISNTICAPAWLILNDPPIINLPLNGSKLKPLSPQNVIFQWTPRHTGSPNAAFSTEYDVKVVEVWPANRNPNDAILTQPAIYETTTNSTTLIYGPDATQLEPGRVYAFRVQARAIAGADHFDLFKNNGYSETVTFIYGDACDAPLNIVAEASTPTRISLSWDASPSQTGYTVQYRVKGQADGNWYSNSSVITSTEIAGLQPSTTYEYQVMSTCASFESTFGNVATITTPDMSQKGYSCGVPLENFNLDPSQLIPVLKVGEVIKTGDFDVTVTKITGGNGVFSGTGDVVVPFLNQVRAHVTFDNITVNNDKRLVKGYMNVTGGGVEIVPAEVMARMDQLSQSLSVADSILGLARQYFASPPDPSSFVPDQVINVPAGIKSVIKDPISGNIIVVDNNGQTQTIPAGKNTAITDGKGNGVIVNQNGGKANVSDPQLATILKREYNLSLTFAKASNTNYGLDQKKLDQLKSNYEKLGDNYYVSWKAVSTQADPVVATYNGKDNITDKIKFELDGAPATATANGNFFTINIAESASQMPSSIVAKATNGDKEQILGKLNVIGYDAKPMNLKIVKVNNAKFDVDPEQIKYQLDTIYSKAVVSWNVEVVSQTLHVSDVADPFDDGSSGLLSNYTKDMKAVINTYGDLHPDTYYLFLIDKAASTGTDKQKLGYMPRAKKAGFIFTKAHSDEVVSIINTMAHELGHGAFTLKHTFDEYAGLQKSTSTNLMDYNNGTNLWKYQWDRIHDPAVVLGLFEGDDAGASVKGASILASILQSVRGANEKKVNTLNISTYSSIKSSTNKFEIGKVRFDFLYVNVMQFSLLDIQTQDINPSERYKDYLKTIDGSNGDYVKFTFHKGGISDRSIPKIGDAGKIVLEIAVNKSDEQKLVAYLFKEPQCTSDFCCAKCGRELKLDVARLQKIFSSNRNINQTHVDLFNKALMAGKFNTCRRQAHFFAQCKVESLNFSRFEEGTEYTIKRFFEVFSGNSNIDEFYEKSFWRTNKHKSYFYANVFERVKDKSKTHSLDDSLQYSRKTKIIYIPINFSPDTSGVYKKSVFTQDEKDKTVENLFSLIYANGVGTGNGNPQSKEGFKYKGRGPIQITGKTTYTDVATRASSLAGETFNWKDNFEAVATNEKDKVFSAVGFFLWKFKDDLSLLDGDNVFPISVKVNGCKERDNSGNCTAVNATEEREKAYNDLMSLVFGICD